MSVTTLRAGIVLAAALVLGVMGGYALLGRRSASTSLRAPIDSRSTSPSVQGGDAPDSASALVMRAPEPAPDAAPPDDVAITARLRQLAQSSPELTLELGRDGNRRFPESPDAAERNWYIVRALVNLQRFHEARDEARSMVERYPKTPWTNDVERHLLVYPLDMPSREQMQEMMRDAGEPGG